MEVLEKTEKNYMLGKPSKHFLIDYLKSLMDQAELLVNGYPRKPTIYTALKHCSRSGMSRSISVYVVLHGRIVKLDHLISDLTNRKIDKNNGGVKIGGCGMDMGFALVNEMFDSLSDVLGDDYKHGRWQSIWDHSWI